MIRPEVAPRAGALGIARREVLEQVAHRGTVPLAELATGWPRTRHHVRLVVRDLSRDGLVAFARLVEDRAPVLALTEDGRRSLALGAVRTTVPGRVRQRPRGERRQPIS